MTLEQQQELKEIVSDQLKAWERHSIYWSKVTDARTVDFNAPEYRQLTHDRREATDRFFDCFQKLACLYGKETVEAFLNDPANECKFPWECN